MKRILAAPTLENVLRLFAHRLNEFSGESRRSYQKAFSSFQLYLVGFYPSGMLLTDNIVENWVIHNFLQGLSKKTITFYLEKVSSLYSGIAFRLASGKTDIFKDAKQKLKDFKPHRNYAYTMNHIYEKIHLLWKRHKDSDTPVLIIEKLFEYKGNSSPVAWIWGYLALKAGIPADVVKGIVHKIPPQLDLLDLCGKTPVEKEYKEDVLRIVRNSIWGEELKWFAMRLRPKKKYDDLMQRFALLSEDIRMPEIFYPCDEIARRVGRKMIWEGKPLIRDVVFFKMRKSEIYPLFTQLYDLAWCYRNPGGQPGDYASIPAKAMDNFKKAIGVLGPEFEVKAAGELKLKPGDKVEIITGEYSGEFAQILKEDKDSSGGNKIYRITLLNANGHWDIGVDARLLKKIK